MGPVLSEDLSNKKRAYMLPPKRDLPDSTREKLRTRKYRSRVSSLSRLLAPLKVLGFTLLIISLCYLAIVQLKHLFFGTSYFELKSIEVIGNSVLPKEEIIKISDVAPGKNVLLLDNDVAKKRLLQSPIIKTAEVKLDGLYNLQITVTERKPIMYAKVGAIFYEIAKDGMIIGVGNCSNVDIPIITGLNIATNRPGDSLAVYRTNMSSGNTDKNIFNNNIGHFFSFFDGINY
jgi:cell division septal protein FtsQ